MQRIINGLNLGLKRKCICPFSRKGKISSIFVKFRLFWKNLACAIIFIFAKIVATIPFSQKYLKFLLRSNSFHSDAPIYLCLYFREMYDRKNVLENKHCRENLPTFHVVQHFSRNGHLSHLLLTSFAFL